MSGTEIIDVLSPDGAVLKQMPRDLAESENYMSANVLIFLFDPLGRVWVQLRPTDKKHFGGLWDITACGGILSAESAIDAAVRETRE
jgi:isopentenyldiphosphate isomerase